MQTYTVSPGDNLSKIAAKYGVSINQITGYRSGNPNLIYPGEVLNIGGSATPSTPSVPKPTSTVTTPGLTPQPTLAPQTVAPGANGQPGSVADLIRMGYTGYQGWNDTEALADFQKTKGQGKGGPSTSSSGTGALTSLGGGVPTIDLNAITQTAYNSPEIVATNQKITEINDKVIARQKALDEASAQIDDNPFYSEATRVGKQAKLREAANNDINTILKEQQLEESKLASLKSDAAIKVNAATGQYNINNQAYQENLQNFMSLVNAGGLTNISPTDLGNYSTATGIPMSVLQSIQTKSQNELVAPQIVSSTDNAGNVTITAVDKNTGNIINQVTAGDVGKAKTTGTGSTSGIDQKSINTTIKSIEGYTASNGTYVGIFPQLVKEYANLLSLQDIYRKYAASPEGKEYGSPGESAADIKEIYDYYRKVS